VRFDGEGDLTALEANLAAQTGFAIYGHHLEVYGVCAECRRAQSKAPADAAPAADPTLHQEGTP
jgi:hypothetical protein